VSESFWNDFRRFFVRGLAAVLPALLTIIIIVWVFNFIQNRVGRYINEGVLYLLSLFFKGRTPAEWEQWWHQPQRWYLNGVGFLLAVIGIYFVGRFLASFVGRSLWGVIEQALTKTPVIKQIYPNVKQVTDFLLREERLDVSRVVAVEYPRKGIWSLGLVTGEGMGPLRETLGAEMLTVFIPSSPTPVTGYTITVRRDEVIDVPWSIDQALRFTVSGGVVHPAQRWPDRRPAALPWAQGAPKNRTEPSAGDGQTRPQEQEEPL